VLRALPLDLDVPGETVDEDEVARPFAVDRVRDCDVPALRVPDLVAIDQVTVTRG
jgi:hypothetical protein